MAINLLISFPYLTKGCLCRKEAAKGARTGGSGEAASNIEMVVVRERFLHMKTKMGET